MKSRLMLAFVFADVVAMAARRGRRLDASGTGISGIAAQPPGLT